MVLVSKRTRDKGLATIIVKHFHFVVLFPFIVVVIKDKMYGLRERKASSVDVISAICGLFIVVIINQNWIISKVEK